MDTGDVKISKIGNNGMQQMTYKRTVVDFGTFIKSPEKYIKGTSVKTTDKVSSKPGDKDYKQLCGKLKRIGESAEALSNLEVLTESQVVEFTDLVKEMYAVKTDILSMDESKEDQEILAEMGKVGDFFSKVGKGIVKAVASTDLGAYVSYFEKNLNGFIKNCIRFNGEKGIGVAGATEDDYKAAAEAGKAAGYDPEKVTDEKMKPIFANMWAQNQKRVEGGAKPFNM